MPVPQDLCSSDLGWPSPPPLMLHYWQLQTSPRLHELSWNKSPCFQLSGRKHSAALMSALAKGQHTPGLFAQRTELFRAQELPQARRSLGGLLQLACSCLAWHPAERPSAQACHTSAQLGCEERSNFQLQYICTYANVFAYRLHICILYANIFAYMQI